MLLNYTEQLKNIFSQNQQCNYEGIAREILRKMSLAEIVESMSYLQNHSKFNYSKLCQQFDLLGYLPSENSVKSYGFETMIDQKFDKEYKTARISLNTGDLISFLIGKYVECRDNEHVFLEVAYQNLVHKIIILIKEQLPLLRSEIDSQSFIPIQKALYIFFLFEKEEAFKKFKNIVRYDLMQRRTSNYHLEHLANAELFFERLNLNYIPQINTIKNQYDVLISDQTFSVSKNQIMDHLDRKDFSNTKIPLIDLNDKFYLNPKNDIIDENVIREILTLFLKVELKIGQFTKSDGVLVSVTDVFLDNMKSPYSSYDETTLIHAKKLLIDSMDDILMKRFVALFYLFIENELLVDINQKIPRILSKYFKMKGYSQATIFNLFSKKLDEEDEFIKTSRELEKKYFIYH